MTLMGFLEAFFSTSVSCRQVRSTLLLMRHAILEHVRRVCGGLRDDTGAGEDVKM